MDCKACEHAHYKRNLHAQGTLAALCATGVMWNRPYVRAGLIASTVIMTAFTFKWAIRYQKSISECATGRYELAAIYYK